MSTGPAEIVGLDQSIDYAEQLAAAAGEHSPVGNEAYLIYLSHRKVAGDGLDSAREMQACFAFAADAAKAHAEYLTQQKTVQEQFDVNPDAGDKGYQTDAAGPHTPAAPEAPPPTPTATDQPISEPDTGRVDGGEPPPPPKPEPEPRPKPEPMVRVNYAVVEVPSGLWQMVGCIDVAPALAYSDDATLTTAIAQHMRRTGELPSGTTVVVSPRHPGQPPMGWVRYIIYSGARSIGQGNIQIDLAKAPASDTTLSAAITQHLRGLGEIAHDHHVRVVKRIS